jgi:tetratricopeptide (TPR) repeat protein
MPINKGEDFLSPEIGKLTEKLQKDPSSKLFFPLAEEYIKCNMMEEAIIVLTDGLKTHPGFHAARVSLGKVYLQKGRMREAKVEFEKVVAQNPDNIMAQKKLAFIYREEGNIDKALQICKAILLSNPKDLEMKNLLAELERFQSNSAAKISQAAPVETEPPQVSSAISEVITRQPEIPSPQPVAEEAVSDGSTQKQSPAPEIVQKQSPPSPDVLTEQTPQRVQKESLEQPNVQSVVPSPVPEVPEPPAQDPSAQKAQVHTDDLDLDSSERKIPVVELNLDEAGSGLSEDDIFSELLGSKPPKSQTPIVQDQTPSQVMSPIPRQQEEEKGPGLERDMATITIAELYVKQGHYEQGIEIYRKILEDNPENEEVRQRLEDALALANLLTKRPREPHQNDTMKLQEPPSKTREASAPVQPASSSPDQLRQAKVQRLQAWLEQLRRSQNT